MTDLTVDIGSFLTIAEAEVLKQRITKADWPQQSAALHWATTIIEAIAFLPSPTDMREHVGTARQLHRLYCRIFDAAVDRASGG